MTCNGMSGIPYEKKAQHHSGKRILHVCQAMTGYDLDMYRTHKSGSYHHVLVDDHLFHWNVLL